MPYDSTNLTIVYSDANQPVGVRANDRAGTVLEWPLIVAMSTAPALLTGTTNETIMGRCTVPGGLVGPLGQGEVHFLFTATNSANNKTCRVRLGGIGGAVIMQSQATASATLRGSAEWANLANDSQLSMGVAAPISAAPGTGTSWVSNHNINTAADFEVVITGQLASAAEQMRLESWRVVVYPST